MHNVYRARRLAQAASTRRGQGGKGAAHFNCGLPPAYEAHGCLPALSRTRCGGVSEGNPALLATQFIVLVADFGGLPRVVRY